MPPDPPCTSNRSPFCNPPRSNTLLQTVKKVSGKAAASLKDRFSGTGKHCSSRTQQYSAYTTPLTNAPPLLPGFQAFTPPVVSTPFLSTPVLFTPVLYTQAQKSLGLGKR